MIHIYCIHEKILICFRRIPLRMSELSLVKIFIEKCDETPKKDLYGIVKDKVSWINYLSALDKVFLCAEYLLNIGETSSSTIGIYSINRYECMIAESSVHLLGGASCCIYSAYTQENVTFVLQETEMEICFVSPETAIALYFNVNLKYTKLKHLIVFDKIENEDAFLKKGIEIHYFQEIMRGKTEFSKNPCIKQIMDGGEHARGTVLEAALGYIKSSGLSLPNSNSIATISYTSGTTGIPKGVVLSHSNFTAVIKAFEDKKLFQLNESDVHLSYLPIAHVLERCVITLMISRGGSIGFYSGNISNIVQDLQILKPTILVAVPKVLERICNLVSDRLSKQCFLVRRLYEIERFRYLKPLLEMFSLNLITKRIKNVFGGRIRACMCGGAFLDPEICERAQSILDCRVFQAYGQTETTGSVFMRPFMCDKLDVVGISMSCTQVKLVDGEVCVKGSSLFKGYYKREQETKNSFINGWFKTGDKALLVDGLYKITGRIKDMFKINNGEYISPEFLESSFLTDFLAKNIKDILVVNNCKNDGIDVLVFGEQDKEGLIKEAIKSRAVELFEKGKIKGYEIPKNIVIVDNKDFQDMSIYYTCTRKKRAPL